MDKERYQHMTLKTPTASGNAPIMCATFAHVVRLHTAVLSTQSHCTRNGTQLQYLRSLPHPHVLGCIPTYRAGLAEPSPSAFHHKGVILLCFGLINGCNIARSRRTPNVFVISFIHIYATSHVPSLRDGTAAQYIITRVLLHVFCDVFCAPRRATSQTCESPPP